MRVKREVRKMNQSKLNKFMREIKSILENAENEIEGLIEDAIEEAERESRDEGSDEGYNEGFEAGKRSVE